VSRFTPDLSREAIVIMTSESVPRCLAVKRVLATTRGAREKSPSNHTGSTRSVREIRIRLMRSLVNPIGNDEMGLQDTSSFRREVNMVDQGGMEVRLLFERFRDLISSGLISNTSKRSEISSVSSCFDTAELRAERSNAQGIDVAHKDRR
jgi:hypothetical protein